MTSGWLDGETATRVGVRVKRPVGDVNTERFDCSLTDVRCDPAETGWVLVFPFWLCADCMCYFTKKVKKKSLVEHLNARILSTKLICFICLDGIQVFKHFHDSIGYRT